ncbi:hypothetical protein PTTG_01448 [Puccinia triticina 1-1 BBBD Race 1]|uniref:Phosphoglycerate mutase n=2 Tax=Puccinia triticina TaxID=208348 RepID=A0A180H4I6_PUCT1|nr:uncharacterized protein PtA15_9A310 [Puccinia triticina]OAV99936.1 hypothetical protein PTTG_01448 [Puccinia triticina 1-1 BBBD Race 1]WAQ88185.1 hypothetical protein PtA15_9A310 [Puccinia triticina]WAR60373.1 hypothetical protein PtB15_9B312 [Puccinia triticina]
MSLRPLTLTLVRHGESTDNIINIWAGHRDATLTNFGHAQAQRLGASFKDQDFHRIFCSDLKRAHLTANQIRLQNRKNPVQTNGQDADQVRLKRSELVVLPLLREQNFGEAEGERWDSGRCTYEGFYSDKSLKFKDGESRDDVYRRAAQFHKEVIIPEWLSILKDQGTTSDDDQEVHFCIVSHGIFLTELITYLKTLASPDQEPTNPEHFSNTGWERIKLTWDFIEQQPVELVRLQKIASNVTAHLAGLKRQPGGIGSAPWDPSQSKLDSFFSKDS